MGKKSRKPQKAAPATAVAPEAAAPPTDEDNVPQSHAQVYCAHKAIAIFDGAADGVARFTIAQYLRYAKSDHSRAEEPRTELSLQLDEADAHTAMLAEGVEGGAISSVVARLTAGDRVDLEFLQMRLPGAPFDAPAVHVCPKLALVSEEEERALVKHFVKKLQAPPLIAPFPLPAYRSGVRGFDHTKATRILCV
mmetsp:Transcript_9924/g.29669  ORF Transcript_9924/g.29669 Transcript_9924/m.29669 type:complete len:194 (-) Transcript_9924:11-592(-)